MPQLVMREAIKKGLEEALQNDPNVLILGEDIGAYGGAYAVALADRNSSRFPAYHRLDFSMRRSFEKSWGTLTPFLNVLNIYNQRNPLFYFYEYEQEPPVRSGISMFPVLPTFGLEVAF